MVAGPVITTRSVHDRAVGFSIRSPGLGEPRGIVRAVLFPQIRGHRHFGAQGSGFVAEDVPIGTVSTDYGFGPHTVFNIDATAVIKSGGGPSGAHSDISHAEVAHLMWQAITNG